MKLARPDLRHPRIVFAGCRALVEGDGDDAGLVAALRARGLHARWLAWDDPEVDDADLVILRSASDHVERRDEFLAWTRRVPNLLNAPEVVAWNSDERYLVDLDAAGVPVAPDPGIATGATALVFLAGEPSHAFTMAPPLSPSEGDAATWDVGRRALAVAAERLGIAPGDLLYARADVSDDDDHPLLRELQLVAPSLGWHRLPERPRADAQRRFALAVESALERLGLGPL